MSRSGGLELTIYRDGMEVGRPTVCQWRTDNFAWRFTIRPVGALSMCTLLQVELSAAMDRAGGWVLALCSLRINSNDLREVPILFRFAADADTLPTGVACFEVPIIVGEYPNTRQTGSEMWHVTIRGFGAE